MPNFSKRCLHAIDRIKDRRLFKEATSNKLFGKVYCGFDPTAQSLHVGNLATICALLNFQLSGHDIILLIGGATGSIGDPSGKSSERIPLEESTIIQNSSSIKSQLLQVFANLEKYAIKRGQNPTGSIEILDNKLWYQNMNVLEFLAGVGRNARVSAMLNRDSVRTRLDSTEGISFTEFSYQLLQAYDFWHLFKKHQCSIQLGGSDQWGNITAGLDLIKKLNKADAEVSGLTIPLITAADGSKFGKSEGNAVWLNESMFSVFDFYQYFCKVPDDKIEDFLHQFTLIPSLEISEIIKTHQQDLKLHAAQRRLAFEVTEMVHGEKNAKKAELMTKLLFDGNMSFSADQILEVVRDEKIYSSIPRSMLKDAITLAVTTGICPSASNARKLIKSGGFYINSQRVHENRKLESQDIYQDKLILLRIGKGNYKVIEVL